MKRNSKTIPPPSPPSPVRGPGRATPDRPRLNLSRGELIFYLRDVHPYWSTPRISPRDIEELELLNLIECSPNALCAIRLTQEGLRVKKQHQPKPPRLARTAR